MMQLPLVAVYCLCASRNLGSEQRFSVVNHVPGCDANGHYSNFRGGAGQGVIPHCLAQVFGDAKTEAISQNPCPWRAERQLYFRMFVCVDEVLDVLW